MSEFGLSDAELAELDADHFQIAAARNKLREKILQHLHRLDRQRQTLKQQLRRLSEGRVSEGLILRFFEEQGVVSSKMVAVVFGRNIKWANSILHRMKAKGVIVSVGTAKWVKVNYGDENNNKVLL